MFSVKLKGSASSLNVYSYTSRLQALRAAQLLASLFGVGYTVDYTLTGDETGDYTVEVQL